MNYCDAAGGGDAIVIGLLTLEGRFLLLVCIYVQCFGFSEIFLDIFFSYSW